MDRLSIGILAHNEAAGIGATLESLRRQSIFVPERRAALGLADVELVVVPNGCSDATHEVAEAALAGFPSTVHIRVRSLSEPGKSNAWNVFIHELSSTAATLLALMDADIELATDDVLEQLIVRLATDPDVQVATDIPTKDFRNFRKLGLFDRLSRDTSAQKEGGRGLCGQLYCARSAALRQIWLPRALPVEDGFIAAMLITNGFTKPVAEGPIACVTSARHYYEPERGYAGFVRHEARIILGSVINTWLFTLLWAEGKKGHVGAYVAKRNEQDPDWVERICEEERARGGRLLVPPSFLLGRLLTLRALPLGRKLTRAPVAVAAMFATLPAFLRANALLRRSAAAKFW